MSEKILLISLRINPAFIQHLIAYAKAVQALGYEAEFLLDPAYSCLPELRQAARILQPEEHLEANWRCAIFMNPSLQNLKTARQLKRFGTRILYVFHEPWQLTWRYIKDEGLKASIVAALAHRFTVPVLQAADHVLLPSQYALQVYRAKDARHNANASYLPLLYDDDFRGDLPALNSQKKYFSYIGKPCRAHGFDQFLALIRHAIRTNADIRFLIASRQPAPPALLQDPVLCRSDRVKVQCGRLLSTDEINRCYATSVCVWNVYRRSTQSGVLPRALMFGAPTVCSRSGSFLEFVRSGENGEFVSPDDPVGIIQVYQQFQARISNYAAQCRLDFTSTFYYKAHLGQVAALLA